MRQSGFSMNDVNWDRSKDFINKAFIQKLSVNRPSLANQNIIGVWYFYTVKPIG